MNEIISEIISDIIMNKQQKEQIKKEFIEKFKNKPILIRGVEGETTLEQYLEEEKWRRKLPLDIRAISNIY